MELKQLLDRGIDEQLANEILNLAKNDLKDMVPRSRLNEETSKNKTLQDTVTALNSKIDTLTSNASDNAELNSIIEQLKTEKDNLQKSYNASLDEMRINSAVESALRDAKAKNIKAVLPFINKNDLKLTEDKTRVLGLSEIVKDLVEGEDTAFLFEGKNTTKIDGIEPKETNVKPNEKPKNEWTYEDWVAEIERQNK